MGIFPKVLLTVRLKKHLKTMAIVNSILGVNMLSLSLKEKKMQKKQKIVCKTRPSEVAR